jgi:tetratricopeptide (TPR) repeat protein
MLFPGLFMLRLIPRWSALVLAGLIASACSEQAKLKRAAERAEKNFAAGQFEKAKIDYLAILRSDLKNPVAIRNLGIIWTEQGLPREALPFLLEATAINPGDAPLRLRLAEALTAAGDFARAEQEAEKVLEQSSDPEALLLLANTARTPEQREKLSQLLDRPEFSAKAGAELAQATIAIREGKLDAARQHTTKALALDAKNPKAHLLDGTLLAGAGELEKAGAAFQRASELSPLRSAARIRHATHLAQHGKPAEAASLLGETLAEAPDFVPARMALAATQFAQKKPADALATLEPVFSLDPNHLEGRILQCTIWLETGETAKAVEGITKLTKTYPKSAALKTLEARIQLQSGQPTAAMAALREALLQQPDFSEAALMLGELQIRHGEAQAALDTAEAVLQKRPDLFSARLLMAMALRAAGRIDDAAKVSTQLVAAAPAAYDAAALHASILRLQSKLPEARAAMEKALALSPGNIEITAQLTEIDLAESKPDAALARAEAFVAAAPESSRGHHLKGQVLATLRRWDEAEQSLRKAIELDPGYIAAYELIAATFLAQNKVPAALAELETAVARGGKTTGTLMVLAKLYEGEGDVTKAAEAYQRVIDAEPDFAPALNNLAYLKLQHSGELDAAYELASKARALQPDAPGIADTFGWALFLRREYPRALAILSESTARLAGHPEANFHLAMAAYFMGDLDAARKAFETALKAESDFPGKSRAQEKLSILALDSATPEGMAGLERFADQDPQDPIARLKLARHIESSAPHKAAELYRGALAINPQLAPAALGLARLCAGPLSDIQQGLELARTARDLLPRDPEAAVVLGRLALLDGNASWAHGLLATDARRAPDPAAALTDLASASIVLGRIADARTAFEDAANAGSTRARESLALLDALGSPAPVSAETARLAAAELTSNPAAPLAALIHARASAQAGSIDPAETALETVLARYPDFAIAQRDLSALLLEKAAESDGSKDINRAADLAQKAARALAGDARLGAIQGQLSYHRKDYTAATRALLDSQTRQPLDAPSLYFLGLAQLQTGEIEDARRHLAQALQKGLSPTLAAKAQKALAP